MVPTTTRRLLAFLSAGLALQLSAAQDAKCYYPNGKEAPEKPCSSAEGSACCPDKWECLDNGMCHYPPDDLYGRYSCTDRKWEADGCPSNMCTYDMTAYGGESIKQCKDHDNQWCCNADDVHVKCCEESPSPRPFFAIQDGKAYATVGAKLASEAPNLATITMLASGSGDGSKPSSTARPSSDKPSDKPSDASSGSAESASPTPTTPLTSLRTEVSSGTAGVSTQIITSVITPTAAPANSDTPADPQPSSKSKSNIGLIVGCAVGIPLALALIGILFWLLRKHRQQKKQKELHSPTPDGFSNGSPEFTGGAKFGAGGLAASEKNRHSGRHTPTPAPNGNAAELPGQGVGPGRPVSTVDGKAELDSGPGFAAGAVPYAPNLVGVGGGNGTAHPHGQGHTPASSWGSAPPGYSPGMQRGQNWGAPAGMAEAPDTSVQRPVENQGVAGQPQQYVAYRPGAPYPSSGAAGQGPLANVPEAVEMPTVKTPPEEK